MRLAPIIALPLLLLSVACGGESTQKGASHVSAGAGGTGGMSGGTGAVSGGADLGGACAEPASSVPDIPPYDGPPLATRDARQVTLQNRCAQTVWPAWRSGGGLDNTVIDNELWLPLSAGSDRTVTAYGGAGELGIWGRTGCSFDQQGNGACETGDCVGFVCQLNTFQFPSNATVYVLDGGFRDGYNVGLRVEGATCGDHACVADVGGCPDASVVTNSCGTAIACSDICSSSTTECCSQGRSGCTQAGPSHDPGEHSDDLVVTFCP